MYIKGLLGKLLILTCLLVLTRAESEHNETPDKEDTTETEAAVTEPPPKKVAKSVVPQTAPSLRTPPFYPLGWYATAPWGWSRPQFNPFPNYIHPANGGSTGYGNSATSCAYAYPNRRYTCYGLGR